MKRYVVGHINCFDNNLILEVIEASSPHDAFWKHSKLQEDSWADCKKDTKGMDPEKLQDWSFDFDMSVAVLELS